MESECAHDTVAPDQAYLDSLTEENEAVQLAIVPLTVGCNACRDGLVPTVTYDETLGYFRQYCNRAENYDFTESDVPCLDIGYVQVWQGYIESEMELVCQLCSVAIPNCLVCETTKSCSMCAVGYF